MSPPLRLTFRGRLLAGGLFGAVGLSIMWLSVSDPGWVSGPWWIGFAAGGVFAAAGLSVATQKTEPARWVGPLSVGMILVGFAAVGNWIAFGPGPRACTGGISALFVSGARRVGDLECRIAFGFGAVVVDALIFMLAMTGVGRLLGSEVWARRIERLGEGAVWLAVAPLLAVVLVLAAVSGFGGAAKGWLRVRVGGRSGADGG